MSYARAWKRTYIMRSRSHFVTTLSAWQVVFTDVQDVLVLERAWAVWNSLKTFNSLAYDVLAIVPRSLGLQLEAPLRDIGYR